MELNQVHTNMTNIKSLTTTSDPFNEFKKLVKMYKRSKFKLKAVANIPDICHCVGLIMLRNVFRLISE